MEASLKFKRLFDLVLSLLLLPILLPLIAMLYVLVRMDGGPGFFGHRRIGNGSREFFCWKLRTMVPDAQQRLAEHLARDPEALEEWNRTYKLLNDPRITPLGSFLRKTSLDELPQIWNVLKGEMSLVGPRPVTGAELERYEGHVSAYLSSRPGITGLWQISGRNELDYHSRVLLDVEYVANRSFLGDISILLGTVRAVLQRTGC